MNFDISSFFDSFNNTYNPVLTAVCSLISAILVYDFTHSIFAAVSSWFKK